MSNNYVQDIRDYIVNNMLIKFIDVKSMPINPHRINLLIEAQVAPSKVLLEKKSPLYTFSATKNEEGTFTCAFVGINSDETIEAIKEALLLY
ncbi:MAG: hypothetical protein ACI35W_01430 [Anaeroplasmataceae bacterium]